MKQGSRCLILLSALLCALSSLVGYLITHGDVTYRLWNSLRLHEEWKPTAVELCDTVEVSLETLLADDRVTVSHTMMLVTFPTVTRKERRQHLLLIRTVMCLLTFLKTLFTL